MPNNVTLFKIDMIWYMFCLLYNSKYTHFSADYSYALTDNGLRQNSKPNDPELTFSFVDRTLTAVSIFLMNTAQKQSQRLMF